MVSSTRMWTQGWPLGSVRSLGRKVCGHTQSCALVWDSFGDLKWPAASWAEGYQQPSHRSPLNVSLRSVGSSLY